MKKIKAAVIGTGFIGPAHIEAIRRLGYADVIALADINIEEAKSKAKELSINKAYGDYKDLLKDKTVDVVHICTPNFLHFPMVKETLLAGKHVVCEKPLAMTFAEGEELLKLANEKKLVTAIHFNMRFYPLIQQARAMVQSGELGEILAVNGSYQQDWLLYDTDYNWRIEPKYSGQSRAVADIGSHWLDCIEFITRLKVQRVCADFYTFHPIRKKPLIPLETYVGRTHQISDYKEIQVNTEDYANVMLKFDKGVPGSMIVNQAAGRKNRMSFEINGTKKSIVWNCENPNEMWIGRRDSNNEILMKDPNLLHKAARQYANYPGGHIEGYPDTSKQLFNNVYKFILDKRANIKADFPTFDDGCRELLLCESIINSAKLEKWVNVEHYGETENVI